MTQTAAHTGPKTSGPPASPNAAAIPTVGDLLAVTLVADISTNIVPGRGKLTGYKVSMVRWPVADLERTLVHLDETDQCAICARSASQMVPLNEATTAGFTDFASLAVPDSPWVCVPCAGILNDYLRKRAMYLLTSAGLQKTEAGGEVFGRILLDPPNPPFVIARGDYKKHTLLRAQVGHDKERFPVVVDDIALVCDLPRVKQIAAKLVEYRSTKAAKDSFYPAWWSQVDPHTATLARFVMYAMEADTGGGPTPRKKPAKTTKRSKKAA